MVAYAREAIVGWGTFATLFTAALAVGWATGSVTLRAFSLLFGIGAGGACGVLAALMAHLSRAPAAHYEPIEGEGGAWGMMEYEERTRLP